MITAGRGNRERRTLVKAKILDAVEKQVRAIFRCYFVTL